MTSRAIPVGDIEGILQGLRAEAQMMSALAFAATSDDDSGLCAGLSQVFQRIDGRIGHAIDLLTGPTG